MKNVVFYSRYKKDVHSPKLLQMMRVMPFGKDFFYFCIDADPITKKKNEDLLLLLEINEVPTVYIQGTKLEGIEAFEWLADEMEKLQNQQQDSNQQQQQQQQQQYRQQQQHQQQEPQNSFQGGFQNQPQQNQQFNGYQNETRTMQPQMNPMQNSGDELNSAFSGMSASDDNTYANPFMETTITGNFDASDISSPIQTKDMGTGDKMDQMVKQYTMDRDNSMPASKQSGNIPIGMSAGMESLGAMRRR